MMMKRAQHLLSVILFATLTGLLAFIPKEDDPIDRLVSSLQRWANENPQEKVYLHTDRPYYTIGDTIWFKAYITIGSLHQLSAKSGALYVELVNEKDSVTQLLKLPVMAGMAKGSFVLDGTLSEGNYRLRSYTQWMRNAGPDYFYDKVFLLKNAERDRVFTKVDYSYTKSGPNTWLTAILNYTDSMGKPLAYLSMKYNLRKNYNTLFKGQEVTDSKGEVRVVLKDFKTEDLAGAHLVTTLEMDDYSVISKAFPLKSSSMQTDVRFFPEGGEMVYGARTKVAFKATGTDGLGLPVKGTITDNDNKEIAAFKSNKFGMGSFFLTPQKGRQYQAKLIYPDGSTNLLKLPQAMEYGYTLGVYYQAETDTIAIKINSSLPFQPDQNNVYLILQSGGAVHFCVKVPMSSRSAVLQIPAKDLPTGIMQVTLFSATGEPMNERIIFIQHDDQMEVKVLTAKKVYAPREMVRVGLEASDSGDSDITANVSVSVMNEDAVPVDDLKENTIFSHLLLSSDIKGYIEQPNYYFHNPTTETKQDLDLLMLTQGYRRFSWKYLISNKPFHLPYIQETLAIEVSGKLKDLWGARVRFGKVFMMNNKLGLVLTETTDKEGRFKFKDLIITEGLRFSVHGRKKNNGKRLEVLLDKYGLQKLTSNVNIGDLSTDFRKVRKLVIEKLTRQEEAQLQQRLAQGKLLREVKIKGRMRTPGLNAIKGQISQTIIFNEQDSGKNIIQALRDRAIPNIKIVNYSAFFNQESMGIFINDKIYPNHADAVKDVMRWDVEDVIKVDIVRSGDVVRPTMFIYTRSVYVVNPIDPTNPWSESKWAPEMINIFPRGFNKVKEFYLPVYGMSSDAVAEKDLRTTVYWNPSVNINEGEGSFRFYNGDRKGNYRLVVEGISSDGLLGRQVFRYRVE